MKRLTLTLTLLIAAFGALAQYNEEDEPKTATGNFSVVNNGIIWQKVFTSNLT